MLHYSVENKHITGYYSLSLNHNVYNLVACPPVALYNAFLSKMLKIIFNNTAKPALRVIPIIIFGIWLVRTPSNNILPSPPALIKAAIVAIPVVLTVAIRKPEINMLKKH